MKYADAFNHIPAEYHHFITDVLGQGYLTVDGRIQMAVDETMGAGLSSLDISTLLFTEPLTGQLLCRAIVRCPSRGVATAHARAFLDGTGANATNPIEVAETSAVGRALGFLGYGVFGGIASSEEVSNAISAQSLPRVENKGQAPSFDPRTRGEPDDIPDPVVSNSWDAAESRPQTGVKPATDKQLNFLRSLAHDRGATGAQIDEMTNGISAKAASELIELIKDKDKRPWIKPAAKPEQKDEPEDDVSEAEKAEFLQNLKGAMDPDPPMTTREFWAQVRPMLEKLGVDEKGEEFRGMVKDVSGEDSTRNLSLENQDEIILSLAKLVSMRDNPDNAGFQVPEYNDEADGLVWEVVAEAAQEVGVDPVALKRQIMTSYKLSHIGQMSNATVDRYLAVFKDESMTAALIKTLSK